MAASKISILSVCAGALFVSAGAAVAGETASDTLFQDMIGAPVVYAVLSRAAPAALFPLNVDCRDFDKTGEKTWSLRKKEIVDLGNWDGPFNIDGPILPHMFVRKGVDLFDVLEGKCGIYAF